MLIMLLGDISTTYPAETTLTSLAFHMVAACSLIHSRSAERTFRSLSAHVVYDESSFSFHLASSFMISFATFEARFEAAFASDSPLAIASSSSYSQFASWP